MELLGWTALSQRIARARDGRQGAEPLQCGGSEREGRIRQETRRRDGDPHVTRDAGERVCVRAGFHSTEASRWILASDESDSAGGVMVIVLRR